jgi:hypothetical protein
MSADVELVYSDIEDGPPWFFVRISEHQALDLASGYVPPAVQAMCTTMLDFQRIDEARAARPVKKTRSKKEPRHS